MQAQPVAVPLIPVVPVAASPGLTVDQRRRYARQLLLPGIGESGQRRLLGARVLVVGAGGLGSPVLLYLAAAGIGTLGIVDDDAVDLTNLQRQVVHDTPAVGEPKTSSAAARVRSLNPDLTVVEHAVRLTAANAVALIGDYDVVVDGSDGFPTRYLVSDTCEALGKPEVWGSVLRFDGQVAVFWAPHGPTYRDLHPNPPPDDAAPSCADVGVSGALCGTVGSLMAAEVVKLVTGHGRPLIGRVLTHDGLAGTFRELRVRPDPRRPRLGAVPTGQDHASPDDASPDDASPDDEGAGDRGPGDRLAVTAEEFVDWLAGDAVLVIDVRDPQERVAVTVPGSLAVPFEDFADADVVARLVERAQGRRMVAICPVGRRSEVAARILRAAGAPDAVHVEGGLRAWLERSG